MVSELSLRSSLKNTDALKIERTIINLHKTQNKCGGKITEICNRVQK